jgi:hypothetical protein
LYIAANLTPAESKIQSILFVVEIQYGELAVIFFQRFIILFCGFDLVDKVAYIYMSAGIPAAASQNKKAACEAAWRGEKILIRSLYQTVRQNASKI